MRPARHVAKAPGPVKVTFAPLAGLISASYTPSASAAGDDNRTRYLWLAGLAFALLSVTGLTLHALSLQFLRVETR